MRGLLLFAFILVTAAVSQQAGVAGQRESFATWFFDYDNDAWPDILLPVIRWRT
jgi:hypothetical protein